MTQLRPYQTQLKADAYQAWAAGSRNVMAVLPTGGGKTVLFAAILGEQPGAAVAIAHRQELVGQMALALAREGVRHRVIAPDSVIRQIVSVQMAELGRNHYDPRAPVAVAGVDTLVRREQDAWARSVGLWVIDEGHHLLAANKWGKAAALFPNARGLAVTATPTRADGRGLGRHADGLIDAMVSGPDMRWLIEQGYLTEYRVFAPPSDIDLRGVDISTATGDYSAPQVRAAVHRSHIIGDVVEHYLRIASGKLGVTFAVDVEAAVEQQQAYLAAGIPAEVVTAKTPDAVRAGVLRRFRARELLQLVNVDLFGEGFDIPAIEVVSMARPTASYGLFAQQFGRALRPLEGKERAVIIDHVGNTLRHGLPDAPRVWTLDAREKRGKSNGPAAIPVRACPECTGVYERVEVACPYCGHEPVPVGRSGPHQVDGDLQELDPAALAALRGEVERVDGAPRIPQHLDGVAARAVHNRHIERQQAQGRLREAIALWGGWRTAEGDGIRQAQRRFYHQFGVDVMTAQTLGAREADTLERAVLTALGKPLPPPVEFMPEEAIDPYSLVFPSLDRGRRWTADEACALHGIAGGTGGGLRLARYAEGQEWVRARWREKAKVCDGWQHVSYVDPYSLVFPSLDRSRRWTTGEACATRGLPGSMRLRAYAAEHGWVSTTWLEGGHTVRGWVCSTPGLVHPAYAVLSARTGPGTVEEIFGRKCGSGSPEYQALKESGWLKRQVQRAGVREHVWFPPAGWVARIDNTVNSQ